MKQKLVIFIVFGVILFTLIGLNAATYVQKEKTPDSEFTPNRSTYNSGTTGTKAFYALLSETGRKVTRWQLPYSDLDPDADGGPETLVLIGTPRRELAETEHSQLLKWVAAGGRLVLIDREPPEKLLVSDPWSLQVEKANDPGIFALDPSDVKQMTTGATAAKPVQPTAYTASINAVQPSRLASSIGLLRKSYDLKTITGSGTSQHVDSADDDGDAEHDLFQNAPLPIPSPKSTVVETEEFQLSPRAGEANISSGREFRVPADGQSVQIPQPKLTPMVAPAVAVGGPVVHLAAGDRNIVVDVSYGSGEIVLVSDPYIVSNAGIALVDNAILATNLVTGRGGPIAFDEYHQGYGVNNNRLFRYFEGTPVIAIFAQLALLIALVLFSQSRRFARPLPDAAPNRLSKLEYVSAMAELQQRTDAFDLAMENIYNDVRRRISRLVGVDNTTVKRPELAKLVAERAKMPIAEVEDLLFKCEDIIHGEPTNKRQTVELIGRLRTIEEKLGVTRASRAKI